MCSAVQKTNSDIQLQNEMYSAVRRINSVIRLQNEAYAAARKTNLDIVSSIPSNGSDKLFLNVTNLKLQSIKYPVQIPLPIEKDPWGASQPLSHILN